MDLRLTFLRLKCDHLQCIVLLPFFYLQKINDIIWLIYGFFGMYICSCFINKSVKKDMLQNAKREPGGVFMSSVHCFITFFYPQKIVNDIIWLFMGFWHVIVSEIKVWKESCYKMQKENRVESLCLLFVSYGRRNVT